MKRLAGVIVAMLLTISSASAQEWPTATPESQGMDSAALATLVEYGGNVNMDSLVVVRNGRVVLDAYYAPFRAGMRHRMNSATKGVMGALTGIAIARGELPAVTTPIGELFPEVRSARDARWKDVTLQHLLDMTTGIEWSESLREPVPTGAIEMERSRNWGEFVLARPMASAPGTAFNYNSGSSHLLSVAIMRKTGMPTEAYARRHLFEPLGISDLRWRKDPQGAASGGFGLYLQTRDMARLGQLYLQRGEWNGRQVLPRAWVERVFAPKMDMDIPGFRYADFWWSIPARQAYFMSGFKRQLILVLPALQIVAATTARGNYPIEDLVSHLERAARSGAPLPENPQAQAALQMRVDGAARPSPPQAQDPVQPLITRASYRLQPNDVGVHEVGFDFTASPPVYRMLMRSRDVIAPIGLGAFAEGDDNGAPLFTRAQWRDASTLEMEQRWPEEAASVRYTLRFGSEELEITRINDSGARATLKARRVD